MQKLKISYEKNGLFLSQVKRTEKTALYSVRLNEHSPICGYEVLIITIDKAEKAFGKDYPGREHYPSNEEFGALGWAWDKLESAGKHFNELVKAENERGAI
jgi:hypothetical protein